MKRNRIIVKCAICDELIETIPCRVLSNKRFACSKKCLICHRSPFKELWQYQKEDDTMRICF